MLKGGRSVLLDEEVTNPGSTVTGNQAKPEQPPPSRGDEIDHDTDPQGGAEQMKQASSRLAVFVDIVRPKVAERVKCFLAHCLQFTKSYDDSENNRA